MHDNIEELNLDTAIIKDTSGKQLRGYDVCMKMSTSMWRTKKEDSGDI